MTAVAIGSETAWCWDRKEQAKLRPCLRCETKFTSGGAGERICPRCKSGALWRSSAAAPSEGGGRA